MSAFSHHKFVLLCNMIIGDALRTGGLEIHSSGVTKEGAEHQFSVRNLRTLKKKVSEGFISPSSLPLSGCREYLRGHAHERGSVECQTRQAFWTLRTLTGNIFPVW